MKALAKNYQLKEDRFGSLESTKKAYSDNSDAYPEYADGLTGGRVSEVSLFQFHSERRFGTNDLETWRIICPNIEELLTHKNSLSILDVGCGVGTWLARIGVKYPGSKGIGIDIVDDFIKKANKIAEDLEIDDRFSFEHGDGTLLTFDDKSFDLVICLHDVANNTPDFKKLIYELHRVARHRVILSVHSIHGPRTCYVASLKEISNFKQHGDICSFIDAQGRQQSLFSHLFTAQEIQEIVSRSAQNILDVKGVDLLSSRFEVTSGSQVPERLLILEQELCRDIETINYFHHIVVVSRP